MTYQAIEQTSDRNSSDCSTGRAASTSAREAYNPATASSGSETQESTAISLPAVSLTGAGAESSAVSTASGSPVSGGWRHGGGEDGDHRVDRHCHDNGGSDGSQGTCSGTESGVGNNGANGSMGEGQSAAQNLPQEVQQLFSSLNSEVSQLTTEVSQLQTELGLGQSSTIGSGAASGESTLPAIGSTASDSTGTSVSAASPTGDGVTTVSTGTVSGSEGVTSGTGSSAGGATTDATIQSLQSTNPQAASILQSLEPATSGMSQTGFNQFETSFASDITSGQYPDEVSAASQAYTQLQSTDPADAAIAEPIIANNFATNGDAAVSYYSATALAGATGSGSDSGTSGSSGTTSGDSSTTGSSATTGSGAAADATIQSLQATDPQAASILKSLEPSASGMSQAGFSQFETDFAGNIISGQYVDEASAASSAYSQLESTDPTDAAIAYPIIGNNFAANGDEPVSYYSGLASGTATTSAGESGATTSSGDSGTATIATSSDPLIASLQSFDPTMAQTLSDAASQLSTAGDASLEQYVSQNYSSPSGDAQLMNQALTQAVLSSSDETALQNLLSTDMPSALATSATGTDSGTSTSTNNPNTTSSDPIIASLQSSDPTMAQTLTDAASQLSAAGDANLEQYVSQNYSSSSGDVQLMSQALTQAGLSSSDSAALQNVLATDLPSALTTSTTAGGGDSTTTTTSGGDSITTTSTTNPTTTPTTNPTTTGTESSGSSTSSGSAGIVGFFGGDTNAQEADSISQALGKEVVPSSYLDWTQPAAQTTQWNIGQYASWVAANPGQGMILGVPLTYDGQTLASTASGANNAEFTQMAEQLVAAGQGNDTIRLGVEMNGPWATDNYDGNPQDFINAYNNAAEAMKAVPGANFSFDWNPADGEYNNIPTEDYYPGNANVNSIGVDVYDQNYGNTSSTPAETWNVLTTEAGGLNELAAFAQQQGKPFAIPEYAVAAPYGQAGNSNAGMYGSGDDPSFINNIASFLNTQAQNEGVAFQSYFDSPSGGVGTTLEGSPNSYAAYVQDFSNGGIDGAET